MPLTKDTPYLLDGFQIINLTLLNTECVLCGVSVNRSISLCINCENDLPRLDTCCKQCGIPFNQIQASSICGKCLQNPPAVDYTLSLLHYESPVDYLISQLKFQQQLSYAAILGDLLKKTILESRYSNGIPDALLPVPLHNKRLVKRGFNQSIEIARAVAKELKLEVLKSSVSRTRNTLAQTDLNASERAKNIKGCFELLTELKDKHIVIIDDVVTTGSTTNELAKLLKKSGVKTVGVWCIARADVNIGALK